MHDEDVEDGHGVVVCVRLGDAVRLVVRVGFEDGEFQTQPEVDGVLGGRFPFQNVLVCSDAVGRAATGEDEPVVAVDALHPRDDLAEHHLDPVADLRRLVLDREHAVLFLLWKFLVHGSVWFQDVFLEIRQSLIQRPMHQHLSIQHQTVKYQILELLRAILVRVVHQLPIHQSIHMIRLEALIPRSGEMQPRHEAVVILAVDQVVNLGRIGVRVPARKVHQTSNAVRLFAYVVVFALEFEEMARRETDRLRAWEVQVGAAQEGCDFAPELVGQVGFCFDADGV